MWKKCPQRVLPLSWPKCALALSKQSKYDCEIYLIPQHERHKALMHQRGNMSILLTSFPIKKSLNCFSSSKNKKKTALMMCTLACYNKKIYARTGEALLSSVH